ncbi:unnamed protein product [Umbelopsis vinacea]
MSDEQHEHTFEQASAGASLTYPLQCSALRKNGHVVIKGRPCRLSTCPPPRLASTDTPRSIVAIDIFTNKQVSYLREKVKLEDLSPSTHNMDVPNVVRNEYSLINVDDGFLSLMLNDGSTKDDVKLPEGELGEKLQEEFDEGKELLVTVVSAMGEEHALAYKEAPKQ